MNRLFEALSEMELVRPTSKGASRQVGVIDPPVSAQGAKSKGFSPEDLPTDIFPTDVASLILVLEQEAGQFSPEAAPTDLAPSHIALPSPASQEELDQILAAAAIADTVAADVALPSPGTKVESPVLPQALPACTAPADTPLASPSPQEEVGLIWAEAVIAATAPADVALPSPGTQVESPILPQALPAHTAPADVALPSPAPQEELSQILAEAAIADTAPADVGLPSPAVQAEENPASQADLILPEPVAPEVSPNDAPAPDESSSRIPPSRPLLEAELAKSPQSGPAKPTASRRVNLWVKPESRLVALTDPDSLGAEKFRALVARLEYLHKQSELTRFQVTSSVISEGKTLVSGNVAVTLAKHFGSKTLLIEGDLHRPTLATILGLSKLPGLSHWWSGRDQDLEQFVCKVDGLPLWFLPAGKPCDRPSDLLRSARFVKAFAELASQYEWVVVDSTPIVPIVDVNLWSRLVDGTLLVVREGVTPVSALKLGLQALDHPNLIGMVLNDAAAVNESKYDAQYYGSPKRKSSG